ncbi:AaceriAGR299Wp [[Ashbya] aceris (nom. inval.)]|nr:AaceriAGR299Wp [[Ashbya] aceris (nom. inval.)]
MAKRPLGLGKKSKQKRQKAEGSAEGNKETTPLDQIHVEVEGGGDPEDSVVQLKALWKSYLQSEREDERMLNGIVHECDRLLRNQEEEGLELGEEFHSIYALALSELAVFRTEDKGREGRESVGEFFDAAAERVDLGLQYFPASDMLALAKAKVIFQRIPLQYISQLTPNSTGSVDVDLQLLLEEGKASFRVVPHDPLAVSEPLDIFSDLLEIIANFGREEEIDEGLDSDAEDEPEEVELPEAHPLYRLREHLPEHAEWLQQQLLALFNVLEKPNAEEEESEATKFYRKIANKLGQSYLDAAAEPSIIFTTLTYEKEDPSADDEKKAQEAQRIAQGLTERAIEFFKEAESAEDPQTWVDTAEVLISLGNLQENESDKQEMLYKQAEEKMVKANKATNGKYKHILDTLLDTKA